MNKKPALIVISLIVILTGAYLVMRGNIAAPLFRYKNPSPTTSTTAQFVSSTVTVTGMVTVQDQENLNFQTPGKLVYLPLGVGDTVRRGQAIASIDMAKLQANLRQAEQDFTAAKAASERLYNNQGSKTDESFDEKVARTAIDAAQNKAYDSVVKARQDITDATLVSSINGIITREDVTQTGVNITPATTFTVADPDTLVFRANVPTGSIYYISEGFPAELAVDGVQNKIQGTIVKIYPSKVTLPNGQAVYQADIAADDLKSQVKLDENGTAIISTGAQHVALVPAWTVLAGKYMWVDTGGTPKLIEISAGKIHGNEIEITGGLTPQDKIIIDPKFITTQHYTIL